MYIPMSAELGFMVAVSDIHFSALPKPPRRWWGALMVALTTVIFIIVELT